MVFVKSTLAALAIAAMASAAHAQTVDLTFPRTPAARWSRS
jgi:hypothetical protein